MMYTYESSGQIYEIRAIHVHPHRRRQLQSPLLSTQLVLATVPDRHFGSGSGSKPNRCQIGGLGRQ
jgi:hypothetical protein